MLRTLDIPRERWTAFLRSFNRILDNRPIRVEVLGRPLGDQEMGRLLHFRGIDWDEKGSDRDTLTLHLASDEGELTHRIVGPLKMYLGQNDLGELEWLAIEETGEAGDVRTLMHFEHLPELQAEYQGGR